MEEGAFCVMFFFLALLCFVDWCVLFKPINQLQWDHSNFVLRGGSYVDDGDKVQIFSMLIPSCFQIKGSFRSAVSFPSFCDNLCCIYLVFYSEDRQLFIIQLMWTLT